MGIKKKDRTGEKRMQKCGLIAEITAYRSAKDIDVALSDGRILKHRTVAELLRGGISGSRKKDRTGEKKMQKCGLEGMITAYRNNRDIDVLLSDGRLLTGQNYKSFCSGNIGSNALSHQGETIVNSQGKKVTLIKWNSYMDVTVMFEDGTIREHVLYQAFRNGFVPHPGDKSSAPIEGHTGEVAIHKRSGMKMKILGGTTKDLTIEFEDGTVVKGASYESFKRGIAGHPSYGQTMDERIGERRMSKSGVMMELIAYRKRDDIDVRFETGEVREHVRYSGFLKGNILPVSKEEAGKSRVGEKRTNSQGFSMEVAEYKGSRCVTIRFGDGAEKKVTYGAFHKGWALYPKKGEYAGFSIKSAWTEGDTHYYTCECRECGFKDILTPLQMEEHQKMHKKTAG